jgi:hypothetical protein
VRSQAHDIADGGNVGGHLHEQDIEAEGHGKAERRALAALHGAPVDPDAQPRGLVRNVLDRGGQGFAKAVDLAHRFNPTG